VTNGCIANPRNHSAPFRQGGLRVELVVVAVKIVNTLGNNFSLKVLPGPAANTIPRVDSRFSIDSLRAQIGSPGFATRTCSLC
jgi:hypothetical protein